MFFGFGEGKSIGEMTKSENKAERTFAKVVLNGFIGGVIIVLLLTFYLLIIS